MQHSDRHGADLRGRFQKPWTVPSEGDFFEKLSKAVVAFEIPIDRIEGKFKLNQNRSDGDRRAVIAALQQSSNPLDRDVAAEMQRTLETS